MSLSVASVEFHFSSVKLVFKPTKFIFFFVVSRHKVGASNLQCAHTINQVSKCDVALNRMSKTHSERDQNFSRSLKKELILAQLLRMKVGVGSKLKIKEGRIIIFLGIWPLAVIKTFGKVGSTCR